MKNKLSIQVLTLKAKSIVGLFRWTYHINYMFVCFPALFHPEAASTDYDYVALPVDLVCNYFFFVLLYGAIYTVNAITDLEEDKNHPIKRFRPLPSGDLSRYEAIAFAGLCLLGAFLGIIRYHGGIYQPTCKRICILYSAFVVVNAIYSLGDFRRTKYRFMIAVTNPLRLALGACIANTTPLSPIEYVITFQFMATLQSLKFRLAAAGNGINSSTPHDAFLELLFVTGSLTSLLTTMVSQEHAAFGFGSIICYAVFVLFPWIEPNVAITYLHFYDLRALQTNTTRRFSRFSRIAYSLFWYGTFRDLASFLGGCIFVLAPSHLLMGIEDLFFPSSMAQVIDGSSKIAFIVGHQRSGTTHLHKSLTAHPDVSCSTMMDLVCPSCAVRWWVATAVRPVLEYILLRRFNSPYHKMGPDEELEEHLWLLFLLRTEALPMLLPSLVDSPYFDQLFQDFVTYDEHDVLFLQRCLIRRILPLLKKEKQQRGKSQSSFLYVARPLGFTMDLTLLKQAFPRSIFILAVRDPSHSMVSWTQLCAINLGEAHNIKSSPRLKKFMQCMYAMYSEPIFWNVIKMAAEVASTTVVVNKSNNMLVVNFQDWTQHPDKVVSRLLDALGLEIIDNNPKELIQPRSESHQQNSLEASAIQPVSLDLKNAYAKTFVEQLKYSGMSPAQLSRSTADEDGMVQYGRNEDTNIHVGVIATTTATTPLWKKISMLMAVVAIFSGVGQWWWYNIAFPYRNALVEHHMRHALGPFLSSPSIHEQNLLQVLDFGCGMGDTSLVLRRIFGENTNITCVDIRQSDRWVADNHTTRLVYDGGTGLPFADGSFDLAVSGQVLHHVHDNEASLVELRRVAPFILIIEDLIQPGTWQELVGHLWDSFCNNDWWENPPHSNRSPSGWSELFAKHGLAEVHSHFTSFIFAKDMMSPVAETVQEYWIQNAVYLLSAV